MEKLLLIDGNSILNRAFYGYPEFVGKNGIPLQGVFGFFNMIHGYIKLLDSNFLGIAFDLPNPTFRHIKFSEYKGTRKEPPNEFIENIKIVEECLKRMGVSVLTHQGFEADDILGTISLKLKDEVEKIIIVSGDKDVLQLIDEKVNVLLPRTVRGENKTEIYDIDKFVDEFHFKPIELIDYKALMGDTSDNIKGIHGIGKKTAEKIISEYHTIENAYDHYKEIKPERYGTLIKENYKDAELSKQLAAIIRNAPIVINKNDLQIPKLNNDVIEYFKELGIYQKIYW